MVVTVGEDRPRGRCRRASVSLELDPRRGWKSEREREIEGQDEASPGPATQGRSLSDEVLVLPRKELVIGVDVSEVLKGAGIALAPDSSGQSFRTNAVSGFDTFVSHNWDTPRFHRYLGICLEINFDRASVSALIVFVLCMFAYIAGEIPVFEVERLGGGRTINGPFITILAVPVYWVVVLFGRNIPGAPAVTVFFDRACIDQSDAKRKTEGIHAIPAFLAASDTMVCLATPLYFQKLWTMFEISLFLTLRPVEKLRVQPPYVATTALFMSFYLSLTAALHGFILVHGYPKWCVWLSICWVLLAGARTLRWWSIQLACMCRHAASLRVETALCKDESDRRMVSEILTDFSRTHTIASLSDSKEVALCKFEAYMQQLVPKAIIAQLGHSGVSVKVMFSSMLPVLAVAVDRVGAAAHQVLDGKASRKYLWTTIVQVAVGQSAMFIIIFMVCCIATSMALGSFSKSLPPRFWPSASVPALLIAMLMLYIVGAIKAVSLLSTSLTPTAALTCFALGVVNSVFMALVVIAR